MVEKDKRKMSSTTWESVQHSTDLSSISKKQKKVENSTLAKISLYAKVWMFVAIIDIAILWDVFFNYGRLVVGFLSWLFGY